MFLLLLMGLGAASVKAQVRIGGNTAPNAAAVLDLNVDDSDAGNKGALALPRVSLANATAQLNGTTPLKGMLVYNIGGTLGAGVYYWDGVTWMVLLPLGLYTTWTKTFDADINVPAIAAGSYVRVTATGVGPRDYCIENAPQKGFMIWSENDRLLLTLYLPTVANPAVTRHFVCYRPTP